MFETLIKAILENDEAEAQIIAYQLQNLSYKEICVAQTLAIKAGNTQIDNIFSLETYR